MKMKQYEWKEGFSYNADPNEVGAELESIERRYGEITPQLIVKEARKKRSILHDFFEWDDTEAAHRYRLWQARNLCSRVCVKIIDDDGEDHVVRAFVSVMKKDERSYTHIAHAMSDEEMRQQILEKAWKELESWRRRYKELEELAVIFNAIERAAKSRKSA